MRLLCVKSLLISNTNYNEKWLLHTRTLESFGTNKYLCESNKLDFNGNIVVSSPSSFLFHLWNLMRSSLANGNFVYFGVCERLMHFICSVKRHNRIVSMCTLKMDILAVCRWKIQTNVHWRVHCTRIRNYFHESITLEIDRTYVSCAQNKRKSSNKKPKCCSNRSFFASKQKL